MPSHPVAFFGPLLLLAFPLLTTIQASAQPDGTAELRPTPKPQDDASQIVPQAGTSQPAASADDITAFAALHESDFDHSACLLSLHLLGTDYTPLAEISDSNEGDCGISRPVEVRQILPGVTLDGSPAMRCDTARRLALWTRDFVIPAGYMLPGAPRLSRIEPGSTYDCRNVNSSESGTISEHALGNAFDVMALGFSNDLRIPIQARQDIGDMTEAFQRAIRGTACLYFTTVLGPGSDAAHDDHLHLDIKARSSGYRLCQ